MVTIFLRTLVLVGLFASFASAQSLGEVAKRERERREKNKETGVAVQEFSEEEIFGEEEDSEESASTDDASAEEPADGERFELGALPAESGAAGDGSENELDRARRERQRQEAMWRSRLAEAQVRIDRARARKQQLEGLFLAEGEYYTDGQGQVVIRSRAHLQQLVAEATAELEAAEAALASLREEARRAGVPPGWLR